jgi:hypothetical protein
MQYTYWQAPPSVGRAALRWGLIMGLLHGIISSLLTALAATIFIKFSGLLTLLSILIASIFFLLAGFFAARQTRKVASGSLAGLWAGFISRVLSTILVVLLNIFFLLPRHPQPGVPTVSVARLEPLFVLELLYLALDLGLGVGFGTLGGLPGKSVSKVPPSPTEQQQPSAPLSMPQAALRRQQTSASIRVPQPAMRQQPSAPIPMPQLPKSVEPPAYDDPAPYGTPFFPPPYPVPPTQSPPPSR